MFFFNMHNVFAKSIPTPSNPEAESSMHSDNQNNGKRKRNKNVLGSPSSFSVDGNFVASPEIDSLFRNMHEAQPKESEKLRKLKDLEKENDLLKKQIAKDTKIKIDSIKEADAKVQQLISAQVVLEADYKKLARAKAKSDKYLDVNKVAQRQIESLVRQILYIFRKIPFFFISFCLLGRRIGRKECSSG